MADLRPWVAPGAMTFALSVNYLGHRTGWWPTLCTTTRSNVTPLAFCAGWGVLTGYLVPHVCRPRRR